MPYKPISWKMMKLQVFGSSHRSDKHVVLLLVVMVMITMVSQGMQAQSLRGISSATLEDGEPIRQSNEGFVNRKVIGGEGLVNRGEETTKILQAQPSGSALPDCSHACGPCFPCQRVTVSFKCSVMESCPMVYRCMCRGKFYHVPCN